MLCINLSEYWTTLLKTEVSFWKRIKYFPFTLRWRNLKTQQSQVILYLCLWKSRSHDYHDVIENSVFKMFSVYANIKRKAGVFNSLRFEELFGKLRFRDGLVWTVGLTVEIKLRCHKFIRRSVDALAQNICIRQINQVETSIVSFNSSPGSRLI